MLGQSCLSDIGHSTYASSTTVANLKQRLVAEWPQEKTVIPKSVNDMKLIHAGKFLENSKTLAESRILFGDLLGGVITMHVIVQPPLAKKKTGLFTSSPLYVNWSLFFNSCNFFVFGNVSQNSLFLISYGIFF
ncbi:hypothetical protein L1049_024095 [Liquidambar formosana]|uniref:Ubiquitin-like domain-containing protein n=1 Tax=Liquidambar formosana TaxID=63359 RepID=A0AAP0S0W1_LIQFO